MASQRIPQTYDPTIQLLEDAADGLRDFGNSVGVKQNTEAAFRGDLEAIVGPPQPDGAALGLKAIWNAAKANKVAKTALFRSAKSNGRVIASACVGVLKLRLGPKWNSEWSNVGFTNGSLEIPDNPLPLLQQIRSYYIAHPDHEMSELAPGIEATAGACVAAINAISEASTASNASNAAAAQAKANLEERLAVARRRLSGLREELSQLLSSQDSRWYAFGFDRPSDPETPEVPEHPKAMAGAPGSGACFCDWDDARRAESYRAKVLQGTTELAERLVTESETHFTGLPQGVPLTLVVSAINDAGESQPGEPVVFTL